MIILGGDGFMLRCLRESYQPDRVFLGLNCGSIGFLLNDVPPNLDALIAQLRGGRYRIQKFPRMEMEAVDLSGNEHHATAVNDIYLERMTGQTCHLRLEIDQITVVNRLVCDGVILSTALGSTAYNFSASGFVCHPSLKVMCVSPICAHSPRLSPVILPLGSRLLLEVISPEKRKAQAVADGVAVPHVASMTVTPCREEVQMAFLEGHDYTAAMLHKVLTV
ncbi:MAG: NAD(+)/NADH kinase [Planctomycetes bacterium]|nr:NAD(+)/NADH kinase [Planctomycetota bacterium]